jgi:hypothetical protein
MAALMGVYELKPILRRSAAIAEFRLEQNRTATAKLILEKKLNGLRFIAVTSSEKKPNF